MVYSVPVGIVRCGTEVAHCPTAVVQLEPLVRLSTAEPHSVYTVMMLDGQSSNRHWMLGNVPGSTLQQGFRWENASDMGGTILSPYWGPHSTTNIYGQFVFRQPRVVSFPPAGPTNRDRCPVGDPNCQQRHDWDYNEYISRMDLGEKVASNYFHCVG